jgi:hypothetical protein
MKRALIVVLTAAALLGACVPVPVPVAPAYAYVRPYPPAPRAEIVGVAPSSNHFWVAGHWYWGGGGYAWRSGYWEVRRPGHAWVNGYWENRPGYGNYYHEGYWR